MLMTNTLICGRDGLMKMGNRFLALIVATGFVLGTTLRAEESQKPPTPTEATIDKMMDQAVRNIGRRYNLNEAQLQETDKLMKREVRRFLKEQEKEIWPLIRDLLTAQAMGKPPESRDDVMRIGKAARPLAKLAMEAILQGNMEWRQYLTEDQLKTHDFDLAEMQKTFAQVDKNFSDWEAGTPSDGPLIPTAEPIAGGPPKPKKPPGGLPGPERRLMTSGVFDAIVDKFLKDYDLDQAQIDTIRSILEEFKAKAVTFQTAKKTELEEVDKKKSAAIAKRDHKAIAEAEAEQNKLLEPFHLLVSEMETRLNALLTTAQKELHAQKNQTADASGKASGAAKPPAKAQPPKPVDQGKKPESPASEPLPKQETPPPAGDNKPKDNR